MPNEPLILPALSLPAPGAAVRGAGLVIQNWQATGVAQEVAPLHVHHADDEAWHVISGALRFRLADREFTAQAGLDGAGPSGGGTHVRERRTGAIAVHHYPALAAGRADQLAARRRAG